MIKKSKIDKRMNGLSDDPVQKKFLDKETRLALQRDNKTEIFNRLLPVAGAVLFLAVLHFSQNFTVAVNVSYDSATLGCVKSQSVVETATQIVKNKVISPDAEEEVEIKPTYSAKLVKNAEILDEEQLVEAIIESSPEIKEAKGLYVGGDFYGAVEDKEAIQTVLDSVLEEHKTGDQGEQVEFVDVVEVVEGIYRSDDVLPEEELSTVIQQEKPIEVQSKHVEISAEVVPFETEVVESTEYALGTEKVEYEGKDGSCTVTSLVTVMEEEEVSREVLTKINDIDSVPRKVIRGTAVIDPLASVQQMTWPITDYKITSGYGARWGTQHSGLDICSSTGVTLDKPVLAAAGGVVLEIRGVGKSGGYGNLVKLDHGNNIQTWYAHNNSIAVSVGQIVAQGEVLAYAGSTGNSTGPHCHFEVRVDGTPKNPLDYLAQ